MSEVAIAMGGVLFLLAAGISVLSVVADNGSKLRNTVDFRFYKNLEIQKRGHYHKIVQ